MKMVLISILLVAIAVLLLGIKVLFVPGSKFPMHLHHTSRPSEKKS